MALIKCHECTHEVSTEASACPRCGAKVRTESGREVSALWTLLLGCIYLAYKKWYISALAALVLAVITGGISWLIVPLFAKKFVDSLEGKS